METESEHPYHIQAIYDLKANYSPEHFRYSIGVCRDVIKQVSADDYRSDQEIARLHILQ